MTTNSEKGRSRHCEAVGDCRSFRSFSFSINHWLHEIDLKTNRIAHLTDIRNGRKWINRVTYQDINDHVNDAAYISTTMKLTRNCVRIMIYSSKANNKYNILSIREYRNQIWYYFTYSNGQKHIKQRKARMWKMTSWITYCISARLDNKISVLDGIDTQTSIPARELTEVRIIVWKCLKIGSGSFEDVSFRMSKNSRNI